MMKKMYVNLLLIAEMPYDLWSQILCFECKSE